MDAAGRSRIAFEDGEPRVGLHQIEAELTGEAQAGREARGQRACGDMDPVALLDAFERHPGSATDPPDGRVEDESREPSCDRDRVGAQLPTGHPLLDDPGLISRDPTHVGKRLSRGDHHGAAAEARQQPASRPSPRKPPGADHASASPLDRR